MGVVETGKEVTGARGLILRPLKSQGVPRGKRLAVLVLGEA